MPSSRSCTTRPTGRGQYAGVPRRVRGDRLPPHQGVHQGHRLRLLPQPLLLRGTRSAVPLTTGSSTSARPGTSTAARQVTTDTTETRVLTSPAGWMLRGTGTPSDSADVQDPLVRPAVQGPGFEGRRQGALEPGAGTSSRRSAPIEVAALRAEIGVGAQNDRKRWAGEPKRYRSQGRTTRRSPTSRSGTRIDSPGWTVSCRTENAAVDFSSFFVRIAGQPKSRTLSFRSDQRGIHVQS